MRLIDADRLIERLSNATAFYGHETAGDFDTGRKLGLIEAEEKVAEEPIIEAEPVKHGQWINDGTCFRGCSECGCRFHFLNKSAIYRWCPNCGARMKGDTNEEP